MDIGRFVDIIWTYKVGLATGALCTIWLTLASILCGTVIGFILAFMGKSQYRAIRLPVKLLVDVFRALPVLVMMIWIYYVLGSVTGGWLQLGGIATAIVALSLSLGAFAAESIRAALAVVPQATIEAAELDGATHWQTVMYVIMPQAMRNMLPNLLGQYVTVLKLSSLASVVAVYEVLHTAQNIVSITYRPLEVYTAVAAIYVVMILPLIWLIERLERLAH